MKPGDAGGEKDNRDMLRLIKQWLEAPVEATDAGGGRRMEGGKANTRGTPQGHAAEALAWTDRVMTRLGLSLNRGKTCLRDARAERFDFLDYSFGPHCFRQTGRWFTGASPSKESVQRLKEKVGAILVDRAPARGVGAVLPSSVGCAFRLP
jgi:RNA-directed DNA polymerase